MRLLASLLPALPLIASGLAVTLPATPAAAQAWRNISCESWNFREAACPVPGAERVQLLRVNGGQCIEGETWIYDGRAIKVRGGCRAQFRVDDNHGWGTGGWDQGWNNNWGNNRPIRLRCESWNFREAICATPAPIASVRIARVIAGDCRDGATWRWDRRSIHVRGGCRADFEILAGASQWQGGGQWTGGPGTGGLPGGRPPVAGLRSVTCESWNFRPASCPVPGARVVQIGRVLGGNCIEGRSWSFDRGVIRVREGCRARFDLH
jgi:hypothetical protein